MFYQGRHFFAVAATAAGLLLSLAANGVQAQSRRFCEGELGEADWDCETLAPIPISAFGEFLPLPGSPDPANPVMYAQVSGEPAFDEVTGERNSNSAVFALLAGGNLCTVAESNGEAVLFDAPEGSFVKDGDVYPTASWLGESVEALLGEDTKLKYIVYSHSHWDHMGGAGFVAEHFAADEPKAITSRTMYKKLLKREERDASTVFGNNRGTPLPEVYNKNTLKVGNLRFTLLKIDIHVTGDWVIYLDKTNRRNKREGMDASVLMVVDVVFPGWSPFFQFGMSEDFAAYYAGLQTLLDVDFDVLVGGHLARVGTKDDVQVKLDYFTDILAGAVLGYESVPTGPVALGTGILDPTNPNFGNLWLLINEQIERVVDICVDYVLDSSARGRNWLEDLSGVDGTLRSQCWAIQRFLCVG